MANKANPVTQGARFVARTIARVIGAGAGVVRSSTQGLRDLYDEAREEYEADRASMRSVGPRPSPEQPNLAVPGSVSERIQSTGDGRSRGGSRTAAPAKSRRRKHAEAEAPVALYGPDGKPLHRRVGRPRKESASAAEPAEPKQRRKPGPKPRGAAAESQATATRKKARAGTKAARTGGSAADGRRRKKIGPVELAAEHRSTEIYSGGDAVRTGSPAEESGHTGHSGESASESSSE